ncbi:hypothetical protein RhiirB3_452282 [Rhizophagus irregularis]|nr:hypothetical protein RhiirB3_452282 [Rhizophagus irregularis]
MLSLIVYYIAHNPDVKRKMLKDIDSIFQGDKMRPITKDNFYRLSYYEASSTHSSKYEIDLEDMSPIKTMKGSIMVNDFLYRFIS